MRSFLPVLHVLGGVIVTLLTLAIVVLMVWKPALWS